MDVLNEDFRRLNADTVNTDSDWLGVAADCDVEFCLAVRDPGGNPTTGITRTASSHGAFTTNNDVKYDSQGGKNAWPRDDYLNFWICNFSGGLLGYAQFPGGPAATDGVVCLYTSIGKPPDNPNPGPYNLGRTATHEVGHWVNLRHIWGDAPCGTDDFIGDTPESDAANYSCPKGHVSCGTKDMVENYMDYTDDDCMNIYTQGQTTRMRAIFNSGGSREPLLSSLGCTPLTSLDAGISQIVSPSGTFCADSIFPVVTLKNFGSTTLTSVDIRYQLDGGPVNTYNWTGSLSSGATQDINLPPSPIAAGAHTYDSYTTNPNGGSDQNSSNDATTSNFTITTPPVGTPVPFWEGFENPTFPPSGWALENGGDASYTWSRTTAASGFDTSTASTRMDNYSSGSSIAGQIDALESPAIDFSAVTTPIGLDFSVAYARYGASNYDQLKVYYSTDCGNTWVGIYNKSGSTLATAPDHTSAFVPTPSEWRRETNSLNFLAGQSNIVFRFESVSGWGNYLYLDDINLYGNQSLPPPVADFTSNTTAICEGGSVDFTDLSTNSPASWSWTFNGGTPGTSANQNPTVTYNTPGTYNVTLTATNASGSDSDTRSGYITVYENPSASITGTDASCSGVCDGSANLSVSGGQNPLTYNWSNGETTQDISNLCADAYTVTVNDANGCQDSSSVTIANTNILTSNITESNANCDGTCDGSADLTPSGGTSPYTYSWSNGETSQDITNLCAGTYTIDITDDNGCQISDSITINQDPAITLSIAGTDENCGGGCDGEADLTVSGGAPPFTYSWSNSETTEDINNLCPGIYTVTVTDNNLCSAVDSVIISQGFIIAAGPDTVICNGSNTMLYGSVTISDSIGIAFSNTTNYAIPDDDDNGNIYSTTIGVQSTVTVSGLCTQNVVNGFIESVCLNIQHIRDNNLDIFLACPDGTWIQLSTDNGGFGDDYTNTCFTPTSVTPITSGGAPFTGNFLPEGNFTNLNGCSTNGVWTLNVQDDGGGSTGTLLDWTIIFNNDTCISWTPGSTLSDSTILNPTATPANSTTYVLTVSDNHGCTTSDSATVTVDNINISISKTDVSCNSGSNGSATLTASGGSAPYSYLWDDPASQTTATATGLSAASYNVTVTDNIGCSGTTSITVSEPSVISVTTSSTDASCGGSDGTATATPSGGTPPYTYLWDDPGLQTTATATGLSAATYNVTVTDSAGCTTSATITISNIAITATIISNTDVICNGDCNGSATVSVSGGTTPYTYFWDNGETSSTATALCGGSHTVTVIDSNSCITNANITINEPGALSASITSSTDVSCYGGSDGSATLTASGGTSPYSYQWGDVGAQTTATATGLPAGVYNVSLTDSNGCSTPGSVSVSEPADLTVSMGSTDENCGASDGTATATQSGGTSPFTYLWDDPASQSTVSATGLSAGTYNVTVTDNNGCTTTGNVTVNNVGGPSITTSSTDVTCNGGSDGSATLTASGGTPPYSYLWDDPATQTTDTATGLAAGTYNITVTDNNGCAAITLVIVSESTAITISTSSTPPSCNGGNDGTATAIPSGGTPPYTYLWDDPATQTTDVAAGLNAGTYNVNVTDTNGCAEITSIAVTELSAITITTNSTDALCGSSDGTATANMSGGTPPYTYLWDDPGSQTTTTATGLFAGIYNITVTDNNSCIATDTITVDNNVPTTTITSSTNVTCSGACDGSATVVATDGVPPYTYLWDNGETSSTAYGLCAGFHTITATDASSCFSTANITINEPDTLSASMSSSTGVSCYGGSDGSATLTASGGTAPYSYLWDDVGVQTTATATGLLSGVYNVSLTDINGCATTGSATVIEPAALTISTSSTDANCGVSDGSATLTASGGTAPYSYLWDDPDSQSTATATGLTAGTYNVTITDNNGCNETASVVINSVGGPAITTSSTDVSCNGGSDGTATATPSGGTPPYTYLWDDWEIQTTATATGLTAGTYNITVMDSNSCASITSVTVSEPSAIIISASSTPATCNGGTDGTATATPSGGTPPYTYLWNDPTSQTTAIAAGLGAGTYNVNIRDNNGCAEASSITVAQPSAITINTSSTEATCGASDGTAIAILSGGTPPYIYLWDDPGTQTTATATGLSAGSYNITVSDSNGCVATASVIINNVVPVATITSSTDITCNGVCDGSATVVASDGVLPYTYLWDNGETSTIAIALCGGSHTITVTDSLGCFSTANITINEPYALSASVTSSTDVSCNGNNDGSATLTASGGTVPYSFLWDDPLVQTTITAISLSPGTYIISITDGNGCTASDTVTITEPAALSASITSSSNVSCNEGSNGSATVTTSGGTTPYTYLWSNGAITQNITGIPSGTYYINVTDANGCNANDSITILEPAFTLSTNINSTDVSCNGYSTGAIDLTVTGGTTPYYYSWSNGAVTQDLTVLSGGIYTVIVTDANNCTTTDSDTIIEPTALIVNTSGTDISCYSACDGTANSLVSGGTLPYTYSWNTIPAQSTANISGLCDGKYIVTITDANGCITVASYTVDEQTALTTPTYINNASCSGACDGDAIVITSGGTPPYNYLWSTTPAQTTTIATGLCAGTYDITVTDTNGCTNTSSITIIESIVLSLTTSSINATCGNSDGSVLVAVSGVTGPIIYQWNDLLAQTTDTATGLAAGTYMVTVIDTNNCYASTSAFLGDTDGPEISFLVTDISCYGANDGEIDITVTNGSPPYSYNWSNNATTEDIGNITDGTYFIIVTDNNNCPASDTIEVGIGTGDCLNIPSGFTPNDDGTNDKWIIRGIYFYPEIVVDVYNRWGSLIFSSQGYTEPWDGTYNGKELPAAAYYYIITLNKDESYTGTVTIFR
ncbi:MAG: gliding motility-associated C-terminal domain-containing protein [Bacteroidota bacterium]